MSDAQFNFESDVFPVVDQLATEAFKSHWDCDRLVADSLSLAYEDHSRCPAAHPRSIAYYAINGARTGRQFSRSAVSLDGPNPKRVAKPEREPFNLWTAPSKRSEDPAELAAFRIDFADWQEVLAVRDRALMLAMLEGELTSVLADQFGLTWGRISQIRRKLVNDWLAFVS